LERFARYPSLEDVPVLISGGGGGIGASLVEHFAQQGAKVGFLDIAEAPSRALIDSLAGKAEHAPELYLADVTDIAGYQKAIAELAVRCGPFRVLVNSAGNDDRHDFRSVDVTYWDNRIALNLRLDFFEGPGRLRGHEGRRRRSDRQLLLDHLGDGRRRVCRLHDVESRYRRTDPLLRARLRA
jgi:NAD(P)-dependent dehydrogenase (short-subunit alcohol dehydrogenase family)